MPGSALSAKYIISFNHPKTHRIDFTIFNLPLYKLRHRDVKQLAQGHTAYK